jgi:hypothetical protein
VTVKVFITVVVPVTAAAASCAEQVGLGFDPDVVKGGARPVLIMRAVDIGVLVDGQPLSTITGVKAQM